MTGIPGIFDPLGALAALTGSSLDAAREIIPERARLVALRVRIEAMADDDPARPEVLDLFRWQAALVEQLWERHLRAIGGSALTGLSPTLAKVIAAIGGSA